MLRVQQRVVVQVTEASILVPLMMGQLGRCRRWFFRDRVCSVPGILFSMSSYFRRWNNSWRAEKFSILSCIFSFLEGDLPVSEERIFFRFHWKWDGDVEALPWPFLSLIFQVIDVLTLVMRSCSAWSHDASQ